VIFLRNSDIVVSLRCGSRRPRHLEGKTQGVHKRFSLRFWACSRPPRVVSGDPIFRAKQPSGVSQTFTRVHALHRWVFTPPTPYLVGWARIQRWTEVDKPIYQRLNTISQRLSNRVGHRPHKRLVQHIASLSNITGCVNHHGPLGQAQNGQIHTNYFSFSDSLKRHFLQLDSRTPSLTTLSK
jgi:hypothetical protein